MIDTRLGVNGVEEIKAHPFFFGIDWRNIRNKKSVWIPEIKSETDCAFFDKFEEEEPWLNPEYQESNRSKKKARKDVNFIGYTYNRHVENQRSSLVTALIDLEQNRGSAIRTNKPIDLKTEGTESIVSSSLNQVPLRESFGKSSETSHPKGKLANSINFKNFINSKTEVEPRQSEPVNKSSNFSKFLQGTTFGSYISDKASKQFPQLKFQNLQNSQARKNSAKGDNNAAEVHPKPSSKKREELNEKFAQINERYSSSNSKAPLKIVNAKLGTNLRDFMFNFK